MREEKKGDQRGRQKGKGKKSDPSCSFTTEFVGPFLISLEIFVADCWSGAADGFDEVLENKWWFEELFCFDVDPAHFRGAFVAW